VQELGLKTADRARGSAAPGLAPWASAPCRVADAQSAARRQVADACLADALEAFGLSGASQGVARWLVGRLLATPVERLAGQMLVFDALVEAEGLQAGGAYALTCLARGMRVRGQDVVPPTGPVLLVSNHPGLADAPALFASLARADLRVFAAPRRLLSALPATARRLITVPDQGRQRLTALRAATRHMRDGGALLTFPGGRIEPDPAVRDGAIAALGQWSACVDVFARHVPGLVVVPVAVSGVLSPAAVDHPLARLRRAPRDRDWLAATLQMLSAAPANVTPELTFGRPIRPERLPAGQSAHAAVCTAMQGLLAGAGSKPRECTP
jgi:hypothetical protein